MSIASKYNKTRLFNVDLSDHERAYKRLVELYNENGEAKVYIIQGFYINKKSQYGDEPVVITNDYLVNIPKFWLEKIKEIFKDEDTISQINAGNAGFKVVRYIKDNQIRYTIEFVDC